MEKTNIILIIIGTITLSFIVVAWFANHRCTVCGNIHMESNELKRCIECGKRFCKDKATHREIVRSSVKGILGSGIHTSVENKRVYSGKPCGYIFINTTIQNSTFYYYCQKHEHLGRKHS